MTRAERRRRTRIVKRRWRRRYMRDNDMDECEYEKMLDKHHHHYGKLRNMKLPMQQGCTCEFCTGFVRHKKRNRQIDQDIMDAQIFEDHNT